MNTHFRTINVFSIYSATRTLQPFFHSPSAIQINVHFMSRWLMQVCKLRLIIRHPDTYSVYPLDPSLSHFFINITMLHTFKKKICRFPSFARCLGKMHPHRSSKISCQPLHGCSADVHVAEIHTGTRYVM